MKYPPLPPPPPTLNQVISALWGPCADPPYMLIGLASFDLIAGIWSIVSPNWKDAVKAGGRGSWLHHMKEVLIDGERVQPKWFVKYVDITVFFFELLDLFLFWFMVGFVTVEQAFNWTSQIWELNGCKPVPNHFYVFSKFPLGLLINNTAWQAAPAWSGCKSNAGYRSLGNSISLPANASASIVVMCHWQNTGGNEDRPVNLKLVDRDTGEVYFLHNMDFEHHDQHYTNAIYVTKFFTGNRARTVEWLTQLTIDYGDIVTWPNDGHLSIEWDVWDPAE